MDKQLKNAVILLVVFGVLIIVLIGWGLISVGKDRACFAQEQWERERPIREQQAREEAEKKRLEEQAEEAEAHNGQSGQVRVSAQADTSKPIYLGEQFAYHVVILGDNRSGLVDITPLAKFNPQKAGERDMSQRSTTIINGKRTEEVSKRYAISYALTAGAIGVTKIPPVSVAVGGKVYKTSAVSVTVVKPGDTEKMDIEVELSMKQCYVGQPLIMTVKWFVWATEAGAVGDFQFNVPLMSEGLFFVEDADDTQQNQNRNRRKVNGEPVTLYQRQVKHDGVDSVEVFFTKVVIPKQAGKIEIRPATISVDMAVGGAQREYKRFVVNSNSLTLDVIRLPGEGHTLEKGVTDED